MNLRTRLSRSNGYRELGMYGESINELESIEGDEKWEYPILKAKYQTYWEAETYDLAEAIARGMRIHHPHLTEGWLMGAECLNKLKGAKEAAEFLLKDEDSFSEQADVLFAIGRYSALANDLGKAKDFVRRAIKLDGKYRAEFLDDSAFDEVWDSF